MICLSVDAKILCCAKYTILTKLVEEQPVWPKSHVCTLD